MPGKIVLCIDDDPDDRELLRDLLSQNENIEIAEAENGLVGLQYLEKAKTENRLPSLIILDMNMPRLDGRQTFGRIKEDELLRHIPVVIYTSSSHPGDKIFFNQRGVQFVTKPISMSQWREAINQMLHHAAL